RNLVIEFESAEPAVAEMKFDLLAQPPFKADAIAVADNKHPDHQFRIDRGPPDVAVERYQLLAKIDQHPRDDWIKTAQEMIRWNVFFKIEKVEQLALIDRPTTHHDLSPSLKTSAGRNHDSSIFRRTFSTASVKLGHSAMSAQCPVCPKADTS